MTLAARKVSSGNIALPQCPARAMVDPQDTNYLALFVQVKYDTVRMVENLPQSPGSQCRLDNQRAAARRLFQREKRIQ
jgi:hypothetical protein